MKKVLLAVVLSALLSGCVGVVPAYNPYGYGYVTGGPLVTAPVYAAPLPAPGYVVPVYQPRCRLTSQWDAWYGMYRTVNVCN